MMRHKDTSDISALDLVNLADTKAYLRVDHTADDDLIEDLIQVATEQVQSMTNTRIKSVTAYGFLEHFKDSDFPVGPVTAVSAVEYKASGDTYSTLDTSRYHIRISTHPARIEFDNTPSLDEDALERVRISFTYGYGTADHPRPAQFAQAVKMLVAHYYDNRSPVATGLTPRAVPLHVESLISTFRFL